MKTEYLMRASYTHVAGLHEIYSNLIDAYEQILGGPRNCRGIAEYYAAKASRDACERRMREITDSL